MSTTNDVYLDAETIPSQREDIVSEIRRDAEIELASKLSEIKAPSNYKDEAKIAEYIATKTAEVKREAEGDLAKRLHSTGLDGAFGEVYCIAAAIDHSEPVVFTRGADYKDTETERRVIRLFFDYVNDNCRFLVRPVGHNIVSFDIRFLHQRCMVLGIRPPRWLPLEPKPWGDEVFDTMVRWAGARDRVKLSKLCRAFGIEDTDEIDGSEVWDCVSRGEYAKVAEHCRIDILKVRAVHRRMSYMGA